MLAEKCIFGNDSVRNQGCCIYFFDSKIYTKKFKFACFKVLNTQSFDWNEYSLLSIYCFIVLGEDFFKKNVLSTLIFKTEKVNAVALYKRGTEL